MHGGQPVEKANSMVSEARKKAVLKRIKYLKPKMTTSPLLIGWTFARSGTLFHLWLLRDGHFEANRGNGDFLFMRFNHRSLGRLLATKLPPDEMARATLFRLGLLKGDDP